MSTDSFYITGDENADRLLADDPLALMIGMLLDQQVPMEWAFKSPHRLSERLGDRFSARGIADMDPDELEEVFRDKPALHRFPASMAERTRKLCRTIVDDYDGEAARIWETAESGDELLTRLRALPGYGEQKAKIFTAVLGKRLDLAPDGWEEAAAPYSDDQPRSVAEVTSEDALERVREFKRARKDKS